MRSRFSIAPKGFKETANPEVCKYRVHEVGIGVQRVRVPPPHLSDPHHLRSREILDDSVDPPFG